MFISFPRNTIELPVHIHLHSYDYHEMVRFQKGVINQTCAQTDQSSLPYKQTGPVKRKTCFPEAIKEVVICIYIEMQIQV